MASNTGTSPGSRFFFKFEHPWQSFAMAGGTVCGSCFDSLLRKSGAICQDLGYKPSLFGCLYSYPSVAVTFCQILMKEPTEEDFLKKNLFLKFLPSACGHLAGAWRYPGFIGPAYKVTLNFYFTEMSD